MNAGPLRIPKPRIVDTLPRDIWQQRQKKLCNFDLDIRQGIDGSDRGSVEHIRQKYEA